MWQSEGFHKGSADIDNAMQRLHRYILELPQYMGKYLDEELRSKPSPGKWSKKEILGHLIDSALNNLKRFTEIQYLPQPYIVQSYKQEDLVQMNNYNELPVDHLVTLWQSLNMQILFVVENTPAEKFNFQVNPKYDNDEMKTLGWIICDYVAHMEHHFKQLSFIH